MVIARKLWAAGALFGVLLAADAVLAQGFIGGGGLVGAEDSAARLPYAYRSPTSAFEPIIEAGLNLSSRVGVGVELVRTEDVNASTTGRFGTFTARESEFMTVGIVRILFLPRARYTVHLLGLIGDVRMKATASTSSFGEATALQETNDGLAVGAGIETQFRVAPHFVIVPTLRGVRRDRSSPIFIQYNGDSSRSSFSLSFGATARLAWQ